MKMRFQPIMSLLFILPVDFTLDFFIYTLDKGKLFSFNKESFFLL
jgi:hypothetical protein